MLISKLIYLTPTRTAGEWFGETSDPIWSWAIFLFPQWTFSFFFMNYVMYFWSILEILQIRDTCTCKNPSRALHVCDPWICCAIPDQICALKPQICILHLWTWTGCSCAVVTNSCVSLGHLLFWWHRLNCMFALHIASTLLNSSQTHLLTHFEELCLSPVAQISE